MSVSPARTPIWLGFGVLLGVACTGPYSTTTEANETEIVCPIGSEGCACTPGGTCDAPLVCASNYCVSPGATTGVDSTSTADATSADSDTLAGGCSPAEDVISVDCAEVTPYCNTKGECVGCMGIASCAKVDPARPACDEASGQCVECTAADTAACTGTTPICDETMSACRACASHDDCPGSACDLASGACFPADQALYVDAAGACDDGDDGSQGAPLCTLKAALARVAQGPKATPRAIRVTGASYPEPLIVPGGYTVAIVRDGRTAAKLTGKGAESLRIDPGARVFLHGLEIRGNTEGHGVGCSGAELWVEASTVAEHTGGLASAGCTVRLRGAVFHKNSSEGIHADGGEVTLANTFVSDNGGFAGRGGLALAGGATASVVYSTFYGNAAPIGLGHSIDCDPEPPAEALTVRNTIAFNLSGTATFSCDGAEVVTHSAFSADADDMNDTNLGLADTQGLLKADAQRPGVYRPVPGSPLMDLASFKDGDPERDFDGDARGKTGFPGADQP